MRQYPRFPSNVFIPGHGYSASQIVSLYSSLRSIFYWGEGTKRDGLAFEEHYASQGIHSSPLLFRSLAINSRLCFLPSCNFELAGFVPRYIRCHECTYIAATDAAYNRFTHPADDFASGPLATSCRPAGIHPPLITLSGSLSI